MNIVEIYEDELRVSHRVIAEQTDNKIKSVNNLITDNIKDLEEFGRLPFKKETLKTNGGMQETKTYYLNEPQATLLITFMRNSEVVKKFKINLVKEFYKMKNHIKSKNKELTPYEKIKLDKELAVLEDQHKKEKEALRKAKEETYKARLETLKTLQELFGYKVDITALAKTENFKGLLPKDLNEIVNKTITELRPQAKAYSATYLLDQHNVNILTKHFNQILVKEDILTDYQVNNKTYKKFKEDNNYYGYNKPFSSKRNLPYSIMFYEDRFEELLNFIRTKGYDFFD